MYVYDSPHYHFTVYESVGDGDGVVVYDYTDFDPVVPVDKFSVMVSMADRYEFIQVHTDVTNYFIDCINNNQPPHLVAGGSVMAEAVYECRQPCRISPVMN